MKKLMELAAERLLREHLPYELDMLGWAYNFLHAQACEEQRKDVALRNAAIECFWTHARNLYEFMTRKGKGTAQGVAAATDFVNGHFYPDLPFEEIDEKMNVQISHLQYERTICSGEKLDGYDMTRFREAVNRAVKSFEAQLTDEARAIWKVRAPIQYVYVSDMRPSATNAIQTAETRGYTGPVAPPSC